MGPLLFNSCSIFETRTYSALSLIRTTPASSRTQCFHLSKLRQFCCELKVIHGIALLCPEPYRIFDYAGLNTH